MVVLPNGDAIVGGEFTHAGVVPVNHIAKWSGTSWSALAAGVDFQVKSLALMQNGDVVAGGLATDANNVLTGFVARWDGATWTQLGPTFDGDVAALAVRTNGELYAAGGFSNVGSEPALRIAMWNGAQWSQVGGGTDQYGLLALAAAPNGDLFVGGVLHTVANGTVSAAKIARWDGVSWHGLDQGLTARVKAIAIDGAGNVIAGGGFGGPVNGGVYPYIARWNGTSWSGLGDGAGMEVNAVLVLPNGDIIAGGSFDNLADGSGGVGITAHKLARWDGFGWSVFLSGFDGDVNALAAADAEGSFFVGGSFTIASRRPALNIARCEVVGGDPPVIIQQPTACAHRHWPVFAVRAQAPAGSTEPAMYLWRRNGSVLGNVAGPSTDLFPTYVNAWTPNLTIAYPSNLATASYDVIVYNSDGCAVSEPIQFHFCPGDFDCSGHATVADIFAFLNAWLAGDPSADYSGSGTNGVYSLSLFIADWFVGC
jgi:hypothetical protein